MDTDISIVAPYWEECDREKAVPLPRWCPAPQIRVCTAMTVATAGLLNRDGHRSGCPVGPARLALDRPHLPRPVPGHDQPVFALRLTAGARLTRGRRAAAPGHCA